MFAPTLKLDTRNWVAAHNILRRYSRTEPGQSLAKAVAFVVEDAYENTKITSPERIDTELNVVSSPAVLKSGKISRDKSRQREEVDVDSQSAISRIVLASLHPGSHYNSWMDRKYALDRMTFSPGQGIAGFWARVLAVATRRVKARHSSSGFFKRSWKAVIGALVPFIPSGYQAKFTRLAGNINPELGSASLSGEGSPQVFLRIDNNLGTDEDFPTVSARRNAAAHRILVPILQQAIDRNYEKQMQIAAERGLLDRAPQLKALGVHVN